MARILIVDDALPDRTRAVDVVRQLGHSPIVATGAESVLDACRRLRPDLVLMDVVLAGSEDGYATTRRIRSDPELFDIPVVLVTSRSTQDDMFRGFRHGAAGYVAKPYMVDELAAVVSRLLVDHAADARR